MKNRRSFLQSIGPVAVVAMLPVPANASREDPCEFYARRLAEALESRHGGNWSVKTDALNRFVLIAR
jgi:hypothetical protein